MVIYMEPRMTPAELACYARHLSGAKSLLEYGAGGSTVFAIENAIASLYTVESDPDWLTKVREHPPSGQW